MRTAVFSSRYLIFFCICGKLYPVVIEAELEIMAKITDILAHMSQVKQVLKAIERLEVEHGAKK